ncbi:MAG: hypothetical protein EBS84_18105, partial [Proteobacteria bacterium]|nr:hypothetical protein [Pseudomonadota bacterium]
MFRTMFIQPGQTRFARPQLGHFIRLDGSPSAVQAVAAALDKAALPPGPAEPRRERWQDFTIGKSVTLIETESKVWPV